MILGEWRMVNGELTMMKKTHLNKIKKAPHNAALQSILFYYLMQLPGIFIQPDNFSIF